MDFADLVQSAEQLTTDCDLSILTGGSAVNRSSSGAVAGTDRRLGGRQGGVQDYGVVGAAAAGAPADLPRVERNLSQLVEAGQQLLSKTARGDIGGQEEVKAAILLGSKGVDLPRIQQQLQSLASSTHAAAAASGTLAGPLEPIRDTDIAGFLRNERENALLSVIEETRRDTFEHVEKMHWDAMAAEWDVDKRRILQALTSATGASGSDLLDVTRSMLRAETSRIHDSTMHMGGGMGGGMGGAGRTGGPPVSVRSPLDHVEIAYAEQVVRYNAVAVSVSAGGTPKPDLLGKFRALFPEEKDQEISVLWEIVAAMTSDLRRQSASDKWRSAPQMGKEIVSRARRHLEGAFKKFVKTSVYSNLQQAQLGGLPGTYHLIKSFLNVKVPAGAPGLEDGLVDGVPVWAMIYYSLRSGDVAAALQAAEQAGQGLAEVARWLEEVRSSPGGRISPHSENLVKLSYRRAVRSSTDPFKRAVHCVLGACDPSDEHNEVATSIDDYLWIKLCQIREEPGSSSGGGEGLSLAQLQTLLAEEYGETHFNAYEQPGLYFQVLFLTGQFEAAIEFLFRIDRLRAHAVHVAMALFESDLLALPGTIASAMISSESGVKRLNFARVVLLYVRKFESTDPREALNYFYFLRNMRSAVNKEGNDNNGSLFMSCVSELALQSREFDLLLGQLSPDGSRTPGLVDHLQTTPGGTQKVIEAVAADSERKGMFEESVKLYDLAGKHEKVIALLNKLLSQVITQPAVPESRRDRIQRTAVEVARRYRVLGHDAPREGAAAFYLMLDLITFFDLCHANKLDEALDTVEKIKIIPLRQSDVDMTVSNFRVLPDELRRNIPDLLLACMSAIFAQYKKAKVGKASTAATSASVAHDRRQGEYREMAKSIITFAGMIPYRMPGDTNARLVQTEVLMN